MMLSPGIESRPHAFEAECFFTNLAIDAVQWIYIVVRTVVTVQMFELKTSSLVVTSRQLFNQKMLVIILEDNKKFLTI